MALIKIRQIVLWLGIGLAIAIVLLVMVMAISPNSVYLDKQLAIASFGKPPISFNNKQLIQVVLSLVKKENKGQQPPLIWILTNRPLPADKHLVAWSFPNRENRTVKAGGCRKPVSLFGGKLLLMELNIYPSKYLSYLKKEEGDALLNNLLLVCLVKGKAQNQAVEFQNEMIRKGVELLDKGGDFMFRLNAK